MQSPVGSLIIQHEQQDISDAPDYEFRGEAAIAGHMTLMIHWLQILDHPQLSLVIDTFSAKKLFREVVLEALNMRQVRANGLQMERNKEIVQYKDKIDELGNEIYKLEQRLKNRESRPKKEVEKDIAQAERHTPIPDHAAGNHD